MALSDLVPGIIEEIKQNKTIIKTNKNLFEIYEGNLKEFLQQKIMAEFSRDTAQEAITRMALINIVIRVVDKLSTIYQPGPTRTVVNGIDSDQELLDWYTDNFNMNVTLNNSNELFNLQRSSLLEPYVSNGLPKLRVIPSHNFWVNSTDEQDPTVPTEVLTFSKDMITVTEEGKQVDEMFAYSDDEFLIVDTSGNILSHKMMDLNNPGINPFNQLPFVYINSSHHLLIPTPDFDMLEMATLIPLLWTDLNYAVKYQSFSTMYGIDLDIGNLRKAPNAFWDIKSKVPGEGSPQIGSIKPEVDISEVLNLIASEFSMYLNTKGIRPGSIGDLSTQNFASGISKLIDEMDIMDHRKKQVAVYEQAEAKLWDLVLQKMHPVWVKSGMVENRTMFSPNASVEVNFITPTPQMQRKEIIAELTDEVSAGFTTKRRAIKALNPRMTDEEVDQLVEEIEEEKATRMPFPAFDQEDDNGSTEEQDQDTNGSNK